MVRAQGGVQNFERKLPTAKEIVPIYAPENGYISEINGYLAGKAVIALGGGRDIITDEIDYSVGIVLKRKIGDRVNKGDLLAEAHIGNTDIYKRVTSIITEAFRIGEEPIEPPVLIAGRV